ncbi:protein SON isoform X2 [Hyperolius riggenbachi]|uniref:protein SON isoform X2 n=1 Tax=Hyperolius riggenbachi TaxID=752182 RepID=UPI0035A38675
MATNIEQIFRSFVVNKFKEIQEEGKLSSENSESSQNGELSAQKAENTSESSASCPQSEGTAQTNQEENTKTDELAKPVNSAVETESPPKELTPAEVISDDEVKRDSSKKKSKKHKKHKSKKKKKKKKKEKHEKRSKSVSSIEDQENVNSETKSVWKPAFASPPKEQSQLNDLLSTRESTDVAAQSSQSILEENLSCAQEDRLPGLQLDVDSGFFGPKCPNEIIKNICSNSSAIVDVGSRPSCEASNLTAQQCLVSPAGENVLETAKSQHSEALYPRSPEAKCIGVNNLDVNIKDSLHTDISGSKSKSKDKSRSRSKSLLRQQRSRSRSLIKVPKSRHSSTKSPKIRQQSRSSSRDQRRRSHSTSVGQRQRSRSKSPGRRRRSQSKTSRYSKSPIRSWWSKSIRNRQRSVSVTRRHKSRTRSPARRCKSRTRSPENRHGSRTWSRSPGRRRKSRSTSRKFRPRSKSPKRNRSDSRSLSRRRNSASQLGSRRQRSRSGSSPRRQKSKSGSAARRRRSGSNTAFKRRRSRSVSLARRRKSRSSSLARRRKSRSTSLARRRKSRSISLARRRKSRSSSLARRRRSTSHARQRRSRSVSAGRKRKSRSTSLVRRRRSRSASPVRRRRSKSASPVRRHKSRSTSAIRRRRSRSASPARRRRSKSASSARRRRSRSASTVRRRRSRSDSSMKRHVSKSSSPVRRQRSISISRRQKFAERLERPSPKAAVKRQSPRDGSVAKAQSSRSSSANRPSKDDSHRRKSRSPSSTRKQSQSTTRNKSESRSVERKDRSRSKSTEVRNPGLQALNEKRSDSPALVQDRLSSPKGNINNDAQATCITSDVNFKSESFCSESKTPVTELLELSSGNQNVTDSSVKSSCHQILPSGKASVTEPLTSPCALVEPYKTVEQPVAVTLHGDTVASEITGVLHPPRIISPDIAEERSCDLIQKSDLETRDTCANRATMSLKTDGTNHRDISGRLHPAASDKRSIESECEFVNQSLQSDNTLQSSSFEAEGSVSTFKDSVLSGKEGIHSSPRSNLFESSKKWISKSEASKNSELNIPPSTCSLSYAGPSLEYSCTLVEGASSASSSDESKSVSIPSHQVPLTNDIPLESGIKPNPYFTDTSTNSESSFSSLTKRQKSTKGQFSSVFDSQVYSSSNRLLKDEDLSSNFSLRNADDETVLQNCTETSPITKNDQSCNDDQKAITIVSGNSAKICLTDITVKSVQESSYLTDHNLSSKYNEACSSENKQSYKLGIQHYQDENKKSSDTESSPQAEADIPQLHLETKLYVNLERTPESAETCELSESQDQKDVNLQDSRLSPDQKICTTFTARTFSSKKNELEVLQPAGPHQSNYNSSEKNREFLLASSKPLYVEHQRYDELHVDASKDTSEASSATKPLQRVEHIRVPKNKNECETFHVEQEPIFAPSGKISSDTPKNFCSVEVTSQKQIQIQEYELPESTLKKPANENREANKHSNVKKIEDGRSKEGAAILSRDSQIDIDKFAEGNVNLDQETCLPISQKAGAEMIVTPVTKKNQCTDVLSKHVEEVTLEIDTEHNQKSEEHHKNTYPVSRTESISDRPESTETQKESKLSMHENQKPPTAVTVQFKFSKTFKTLPSSQICNTSDESSDKENSKVISSSPTRTLSSSTLLSSSCEVSSKPSTKLPQNILQQEQLDVTFEPLKLDSLSNAEQVGNDLLQQDTVQATDDSQSSGTIKHTFPHLSNASSKLGVKQRQYRSRSVAQDSRSPSVDRGKTSRSRSKSATRKRRSRSKSVSKKKRSQSSSRKKSSHSKSSKRKPSRSKSRGRKRRSQSKSKSKKKHSPSKSSGKRKRSRSKSTEAVKSVGKEQGSRSKSKTTRKRAQSKSPVGRSRSKSATRKSSHSKTTDIRKDSQSKSLSSRSRSRSASASRIHISRTKALLHRKRSSSGSKSKSPRRRSLSKDKGRSHSRSPAQRHQSRSRSRTGRQRSRSRRRWRRSRSLSLSRRRSRSSSKTSHSLSTKKRRSVSKSPTRSRRSRSQVKQKDKSPLSKRKSISPLPQKKTIQSKATAFKHSIGLKSLIQKQLSQAKSQGSGGKLSNKEQIPLSTIAARAQLSASTFSPRAQVSTSSLTTVPVPNLAEVPLPSEPGSGQVPVPSLPPADQLPVTGLAAEAAVPVPDLSNATQWHVPDISSGAQWPVPDITAGTQWSMSDMTAGAQWPMADLAASSHWPMHDLTMGAQWSVPDLAAGTPWAVPDVTTGAQWTVPDLTASTHWTVPDLTARSQWAMTNLAPGAQWAVPDLAATAQWAVPDLTSGTHIQSADLAPEAQVPGSDLTAEAQVPGSDLGTEAQVPGSDLAAEAQVPGSDLVSEAQVPVQDNVAYGSDNELVSEGHNMMPDVAAEALVPVANGTLVPDVAAGIPLPDVTAAAQIPVPDVAATAHMPVPDVATTAQSLMSGYAVARSFRTVHESMFDSPPKPSDYSDLSSATGESADIFCVNEKLVSAEQLESETLNRTVQETVLETSTSIADMLPCEASSKHAIVPEISASPPQEDTTLNSENQLNDDHYSTSSLTLSEPCLQPDNPLLTDTANNSSSTDVLYGSHDDDNCPFLPTSDASNPLLIDSNIESSTNLLLEPCVNIVEPYTSPDHATLVESYSSPDHSLLIEPYCSPDHALLVTEFSASEHPLLTEPQVVSDPLELTDSCASPGPFSKAEANSNFGHSPQESVVRDIHADCHQQIEHITTLPFSEPEECYNGSNQPESVEPDASPSCHKSTKLNADLDIPQLVEPYTSPEHPQIVEAYSSPEHLPLVEACNSPECPQLVEPYSSPQCPKLVEPYGSPESQDLTESFDNPVHPQLVQPYTSSEHSQVVQSCVSPEHPQLVQQYASPKNLQLVQSYAIPKLPQLVQAYVSPEHPQLDEPYTSPEHPQLVQAYASPEHPQLVQQYASPEYPQLVQPYASPEHPQLVQPYASAKTLQLVQSYDSPECLEQVQSYTNPEDPHPVQLCARPEDVVVQACASPEHLQLVEICSSTEQPQLVDTSSSPEKPQLVEACSKPAESPLHESCVSPESPLLAEACSSPEHPQLAQPCASPEQQQLVQTYSDPYDPQLGGSYTSPDHSQLVQPFSIPNVVDLSTSSEQLQASPPYASSDCLELVQPYDNSGHLQLNQTLNSQVCVQQDHPSVSPEQVQIVEKDVTPECIYGDQIASPDHPQIVQSCESSLEVNQSQASEEYQQLVQSYLSPNPPQLTESEDRPNHSLPVESLSSSDQTPATVSNSGPDLPVNIDSDENPQLIEAALPEVRFEPSPEKHDKAGPLPEESFCSVVQRSSHENSPSHSLSVLEDCHSTSIKIQSQEPFSSAHKSPYNDPSESSDHVVSKEDCSDSAQYLTVHYTSGTVQYHSEDENPLEQELCSLEANALSEQTELTKPQSFPDKSETEECFRSASVPHLDKVYSSGGQGLSDASVHITAQPSTEEQSTTTSRLLKGDLDVPDVEEPTAVLHTPLHSSAHSIMPLSDGARCSEVSLPDRSLSSVNAHSDDRAVPSLEQEEKPESFELQKTSDVSEQHLANKTPHPSECDSVDIAAETQVLLDKSYSSPVHSLQHKILENYSYSLIDKSSFSPSQSVQENSLSGTEQKGVWDVTGEIHSERVYSKDSPIINNPEINDIPTLADPVLGVPLKSSQPLSPEQDHHKSVESPLSADLPLLSHDKMKSFTPEQVSALSVEAEMPITEDSEDLGLDHQYKIPPPDLLPFDSEQPSYLFPNSESSSEPVLFNSQQPPELLPYDSEQPTNPFQIISDFSSEQDSSVFHTPPELLPYDSEQSTELLKSTPESSEEKMPVCVSEDLSILPSDVVSPTAASAVNQVYLDINPDSIAEVDTSATEKVSMAEERVDDGEPSIEANYTPIVLANQLSSPEYNLKSSKATPPLEKQHSEVSEVLSVKPLPIVDSVQELPPSEFLCEETLCLPEQQAVPDTTPQPLTEKEVCVEQAPHVSEDFLESVLPLCTEQCKTDNISLLSNVSSSFEVQTSSGDIGNLSQQEEPPLTQLHAAMDVIKKRSRSKSLTKSEIPQSQSTSKEKDSHSKSANSAARSCSQSKARKKSRSKSTTRKKRSRSRSATRVKKSRSKSVVKTKRSRSKSTAKRKKSRSASGTRRRRPRSRSGSRKRRSRSTSIPHKQSSRSSSIARRRRSRSSHRRRSHSSSVDHKRSHSHSVVRRKRSRSPSVARRRRSRTRSPVRRRRSRSSSITRRRHSRSSSVARRRRSRSSSITRRRHSRSSSVSRRRHSPSLPIARRRRSPSAPLSRWRRSRSPSSAHKRRSRSVSRKKRSRSPSVSHKRRSPSATRRRRSRTPSAPRRKRSPSASRKRHSRSSSATRKRLSRSASVSKKKRSRSLSQSRKMRSRTPSIASKRKSESKSPTPKSPKNTLSKADRSRSRSQSNTTRKRKSHSRSLSRDKSKANEKRRKRSSSKEHYSTKQRRKSRTPPRRKKSRSPARRASPCRSPVRRRRSRSPVRRKSFSRSPVRRKRSRSRDQSMDSARSPKRLTDLDKAQLLEIAKANAAAMCAKAGVPLPLSLKPVVTPAIPTDDKVTQRTYGTTIQELTEKCKQIAQSKEDDEVVNKPHDSDEDEEDKPFYNHPFKVTEHKPISFSLLNPNLKTAPKTQVTLTKEFPVSSGSQHRKKETDKVYGEWVPVDKKTEDSKDDVFTTTVPSQF